MVAVDKLLMRQRELETEILCLQDVVQRLSERIMTLENFIKDKYGIGYIFITWNYCTYLLWLIVSNNDTECPTGSLALAEVTADCTRTPSAFKQITNKDSGGVADVFVSGGEEEMQRAPPRSLLLLDHHMTQADGTIPQSVGHTLEESGFVNS